jgi:signal transduction histidine kinase
VVEAINPRRSLVAGAITLIVCLAITFSFAAAIWVGGIAHDNLLAQHVRRFMLESDQLTADFAQSLTAHSNAVRAAKALTEASAHEGHSNDLRGVFDELVSAYPQYDWIAVADSAGRIVKSEGASSVEALVNDAPWFKEGRRGIWIGMIEDPAVSTARPTDTTALGDISMPLKGNSGETLGVIAAHLGLHRAPGRIQRIAGEAEINEVTQAYVIDRSGVVVIGPNDARNRAWQGVPIRGRLQIASILKSTGATASEIEDAPQFQRLPDGRTVLVSQSSLTGDDLAPLGLKVLLAEPESRVNQRGNAVAARILWVSLALGAATALIGALGARQLTRRLRKLTLSVTSRGRTGSRIDIPDGSDEVAQLGAAFSNLVDDLEQERRELKMLSDELERRVSIRTHEVERLAEESRYAAVVRERLRIARDLHDTLAHSMMAILSEIRLLKRLQMHEPTAVLEELSRAEKIAQEGLEEARAAITQMRGSAVRETGIGPALRNAFERFTNLTGISGSFFADSDAAGFGDERAETLLRMAQETLRNVERHARATEVSIRLELTNREMLELCIKDNGIGFDPQRAQPGHYGLVGLREQAQIIGADLEIDSTANEGTSIRVSLRVSPISFNPIARVRAS